MSESLNVKSESELTDFCLNAFVSLAHPFVMYPVEVAPLVDLSAEQQ